MRMSSFGGKHCNWKSVLYRELFRVSFIRGSSIHCGHTLVAVELSGMIEATTSDCAVVGGDVIDTLFDRLRGKVNDWDIDRSAVCTVCVVCIQYISIDTLKHMFGATVHMCMPTTRWYIHIHNTETQYTHVPHTVHVTVHKPGHDNDEPGHDRAIQARDSWTI